MLTAGELGELQTEQFRHDQRNHSDIICLSKSDRLKHYGLHFAKYVGRLARDDASKTPIRTLTDTALVALSAANTLHQRLGDETFENPIDLGSDALRPLADAAGRFADACEKIDHLEEFLDIARTANLDVVRWTLAYASMHQSDLRALISERRKELATRQFYVRD